MKAQLIETLHALTALHAPPAFEQPVVRHLRAAIAPLADEVQVNHLVDEYRLLVYPLVVGGGKKLFPDGLRLNLRIVPSVACGWRRRSTLRPTSTPLSCSGSLTLPL